MVTELWCHTTFNSRGAWHTVYAMLLSIISEMQPEIHTLENAIFSIGGVPALEVSSKEQTLSHQSYTFSNGGVNIITISSDLKQKLKVKWLHKICTQ